MSKDILHGTLSALNKNKMNTYHLPSQKKLLLGLPQNPKLLPIPEEDNKSQLSIDHIESISQDQIKDKPSESKETKEKLSDPNSPLGVDISRLNLSEEEALIFTQIGTRIGKKLDERIANGSQNIKEVDDAITSIRESKSLDSAKPHIDFLRKVEGRIDQFTDLTNTIQNFVERHPGFSSFEQDVKSIKQSCKNTKTYGGFQYGIEELPKYKNFCTQYVKLQVAMNARKHLIVAQDQEQVISLYKSLKASSFDEMINTLGKMQSICDRYDAVIKEKIDLEGFLQKKSELLIRVNSFFKNEEITETQRQQITNQLVDLNNYEKETKESLQYGFSMILNDPKLETAQKLEIQKKQNDLDSLPFDQFIARHNYDETMKDMGYFEKVIDVILLPSEPSVETSSVNNSSDPGVETTGDEKIFRYAGQTSEILADIDKVNEIQNETLPQEKNLAKQDETYRFQPLTQKSNVGQVIPNEIQKPIATPRNTQSRLKGFMSKLIPVKLISVLTAATVAISNPSNLDKNTDMAQKPFIPSNEKERMMQSLDEAGLRGQLYQAARQFPGNITSIKQLAEKRADLDKPSLTEPEKRVKIQRFIDGIRVSPKETTVEKIFETVRTENEGKPDIIKKIDEAEQIYDSKNN